MSDFFDGFMALCVGTWCYGHIVCEIINSTCWWVVSIWWWMVGCWSIYRQVVGYVSMIPSLNVMVSVLVISMKVEPWVFLLCGLLFGRALISILVHVIGRWWFTFEGKWTLGCCRHGGDCASSALYWGWIMTCYFNFVGLWVSVRGIQYCGCENYVQDGVWWTSNLQGHFGFSTYCQPVFVQGQAS